LHRADVHAAAATVRLALIHHAPPERARLQQSPIHTDSVDEQRFRHIVSPPFAASARVPL
jgi:hypothetical protein